MFIATRSGWWFAEGLDEKTAEDGKFALHRLYSSANPTYEGSANGSRALGPRAPNNRLQ